MEYEITGKFRLYLNAQNKKEAYDKAYEIFDYNLKDIVEFEVDEIERTYCDND